MILTPDRPWLAPFVEEGDADLGPALARYHEGQARYFEGQGPARFTVQYGGPDENGLHTRARRIIHPGPGQLELTMACPPRFGTTRNLEHDTIGADVEATMLALRAQRAWPWQRLVADVAGEIAPGGRGFVYPVVVLLVPRRAGKSSLLLAEGLTHCRRGLDVRTWYTAQTREDAAKEFRDEWLPQLEGSALMQRAFRVRRSQGSEALLARRGSSRLQIFPPSAGAMHGKSIDTVFFDEAWFFDIVSGVALETGAQPAQLTRPWRQMWIVSAGGTFASTWLERWIVLGQAGTAGVAYFEWSADNEHPAYDPADPAVWAAAHPGLGHGFELADMAAMWETKTSVEDFERSYLNVWDRPSYASIAAVPVDAWNACADPTSSPAGPVALAIDVTPDRDRAAIAAAGIRADGRIHVEVGDAHPGTGWVVPRVAELLERFAPVAIVLDPASPAGALLEQLEKITAVRAVSGREYGQACGAFYDDVIGGRVAHRAQPLLDDTIGASRRRNMGDSWVWARRAGADLSPLVAVTLARHAIAVGATPAVD